MEGIYIAYVSGSEGYSAILFVLRDGLITGADIGGVRYRGRYELKEGALQGALSVQYPTDGQTITGVAPPGGMPIQIPFKIEFSAIGSGYIGLNTPVGFVTASISKIEELP